MGLVNDLVRYFGPTSKELQKNRQTKRKLFYAAKKRYTRCVVKNCKIPANKVDQCGKRCKKQLDCVKKHCREEDNEYSRTAFF
jgi:hypothetical protein